MDRVWQSCSFWCCEVKLVKSKYPNWATITYPCKSRMLWYIDVKKKDYMRPNFFGLQIFSRDIYSMWLIKCNCSIYFINFVSIIHIMFDSVSLTITSVCNKNWIVQIKFDNAVSHVLFEMMFLPRAVHWNGLANATLSFLMMHSSDISPWTREFSKLYVLNLHVSLCVGQLRWSHCLIISSKSLSLSLYKFSNTAFSYQPNHLYPNRCNHWIGPPSILIS
jgi:hypothetical protein